MTHLSPVVRCDPSDGGKRLVIDCAALQKNALGSSIAINGACLTLARVEGSSLSFDVVPETLSRTDIGELKAGDRVNVEQSLRAGDELGGHLVYGHVDATTIVIKKIHEGQGFRIWCVTPPALVPTIVEKGYVALDGVSVTIAATSEGEFAVALIPETLARTTLGLKDVGSTLNIEVDPVARYVAHALGKDIRSEP